MEGTHQMLALFTKPFLGAEVARAVALDPNSEAVRAARQNRHVALELAAETGAGWYAPRLRVVR